MTEPSHPEHELDPIRREANRWVARLAARDITVGEGEELKRWRAEDPAHEEAFRDAARLWRNLGPVAEEMTRERRSRLSHALGLTQTKVGRRALLTGTVSTAVAAAAATYVVIRPPLDLWPSWSEWSADHRTAKGEKKNVVVDQNITLELNTQTSIAIRSTPTEPRVELISGEALISTTRAPASPLVVIAARGKTVASQANFNVRCIDDVVAISCLSGMVDVEVGDQVLRLHRGQQVSYSDSRIGEPIAIDPDQAAAWRTGVLIVKDRPLSEVISEVNRYRPGKIIIMNADLGRRVVNGTFQLDRLDDFVGAVQQLFGAQARTLPGGIVVLT